MRYLPQHGNLYILEKEKKGGIKLNSNHTTRASPVKHLFSSELQRPNVPHHHRLQQVNECTVTASLLQEGSAHCLLLCLLHQQIQVTDVLHGTVQLGAQVTPACMRQSKGAEAQMREGRVERGKTETKRVE